MCKLFSINNTSKLTKNQLENVVKTVENAMKVEKDGFGITALHNNGHIAARKYLKTYEASILKDSSPWTPVSKKSYQDIGKIFPDDITSLILHGRTSTNSVSLINTHPIIKNDHFLSHNGVVEDSGPKYIPTTSNDTEHIVERLTTQGLSAIEKYISGYYACMYFKKGSDSLHIFRDNIATLHIGYSEDLESYILATTQDLIKQVAKALKIKINNIDEVEDNVYFELTASNDFENIQYFTPKGRSSYSDSKSHLSLGYSFNDYSGKEYYSKNDYYSMDSEDEFLWEVENNADNTWTFMNDRISYTFEEFMKLSDDEKLKCEVIRSDGTICSVDVQRNGKIYGT